VSRTTATAFAPGKIGNAGVGFDLLGHVIDRPRAVTTVRYIGQPTVRIDAVRNSVV